LFTGVLYRPRFFHEIVFDKTLREITRYNDDLTFRIATLINRVPVVNGCCETLGSCVLQKLTEDELVKKSPELWDKNQVMNTQMWFTAVAYVKQRGLLKFDRLLQEFVDVDRPGCLEYSRNLTHISPVPIEGIDTPPVPFGLNYQDNFTCGIHFCEADELNRAKTVKFG
jgi:hypothetical protein